MVNRSHRDAAQSISLEYHPPSSNFTRCQVTSRARAGFHDSVFCDIDFYQIFLSQLESAIVHKNIIMFLTDSNGNRFSSFFYCIHPLIIKPEPEGYVWNES